MKRILLLCAIMVSTIMAAQGHETFDNFETTGNSYKNGNFTGNDGVVWTYTQCRGDIELNGKAITLGRNRAEGQNFYSSVIPGGVGTLEFAYMQAFNTDVHLEVYVNDELLYTATSNNEKEIPKNTGAITFEVEGDFVLKFVNPADAGQVTVDDIIWTAHGTVGVEDFETSVFSFFPNPAKNVVNISSKETVVNVAAFNLLGQQVINKKQFANGKVDISALPSGAYIFKVTLENGTNKTFKVLKQ